MMQPTTVFDVLERKYRELLTNANNHLSGGSAKDFAEYRETCGYIRGVETALREVQDLARSYLEDDDD